MTHARMQIVQSMNQMSNDQSAEDTNALQRGMMDNVLDPEIEPLPLTKIKKSKSVSKLASSRFKIKKSELNDRRKFVEA